MNQQEQGIMTYFEAEAHSFVVRVWRENRDDPEDTAEWRGWLEHVESGQRHYFRNVAEISRIVSYYIGDSDELDGQVFMPIQAKDQPK